MVGRLICLMSMAFALLTSGKLSSPPTIEQALVERGIGTSNDELRSALHNPSGEIRGMAAMQLAENGDKNAIQVITLVLRDEQDAMVRFNLARALLKFGDSGGRSAMEHFCTDMTVRADLRIEAAGDLSSVRSKICFTSVAQILAVSENSAEKQAALDYLIRAHTEATSLSEVNLLVSGLKLSLQDESPTVRQLAAECIARYHLTSAKPNLRTAAQKETDPETKAALQSAEKALSK